MSKALIATDTSGSVRRSPMVPQYLQTGNMRRRASLPTMTGVTSARGALYTSQSAMARSRSAHMLASAAQIASSESSPWSGAMRTAAGYLEGHAVARTEYGALGRSWL